MRCFLYPLLYPAHSDSPPPTSTGHPGTRCSPSPHPLAAPPSPLLLEGILSDLVEIGGSFQPSRVARRPGVGVVASGA